MIVITVTSCFPEHLLSTSAQTVGKKKSGQPLQKRFMNMRIERWIIFGIRMIDPSLYKQKTEEKYGYCIFRFIVIYPSRSNGFRNSKR